MSACAGRCIAPIQALPAADLAAGRTALQVLPLVLGLRRAGDPAIRHTARTRPGRLAAAALQPLESRRVRPRRGPAPLPAPKPPVPERLTMLLVYANIFQPLIDVFEAVLKFFHDSVGISWGLSIVRADDRRPRGRCCR